MTTKERRFTRKEAATFCTEQCRDAWECDRAALLIRPPWKLKGATSEQLIDHATACSRLGICRYCESKLTPQGGDDGA